MATKRIKVLVMTTNVGYTQTLCATEQFPIEGEDKEKLRETLDCNTHFTEEILTDKWLLETKGEKSIKEEFDGFIDDLAQGKDAEYFEDFYRWDKVELFI